MSFQTHSAYMLFYERLDNPANDSDSQENTETHCTDLSASTADFLQTEVTEEPEEEEATRVELKIDLTRELLNVSKG